MKRLLLLIFFLLLLALGISFSVHNPAKVTLDYYFGTFTGSLSLIIIAAFVTGILLGMISCLLLVYTQRRRIARLRKNLDVCEQEVRNLRQLPLLENH